MKSARKILFRCDGSLEIGLGHIVRCMALANELKGNHNCNVFFAHREGQLGIDIVKREFSEVFYYNSTIDYKKWLSGCIEQNKIEVLVLDTRDDMDVTILKYLKNKYDLLIVDIDDPEEKRLLADIAFYPPLLQLNDMDWGEFRGKLFTGWEYVILRDDFNHKYPRKRNIIPNILIAMGGTDPTNMTQFVVQALNKIEEKFVVTILLGPGYAFSDELREYLQNVKFYFEIFVDPVNIIEPMVKSDLAIISFGQTAYELAALSIPAIYICHSIDHLKSSELFVNHGIGISLGLFSNLTQQKLNEAVSSCLTDKKKIQQMGDCANGLRISNLNKISSIILDQND